MTRTSVCAYVQYEDVFVVTTGITIILSVD